MTRMWTIFISSLVLAATATAQMEMPKPGTELRSSISS